MLEWHNVWWAPYFFFFFFILTSYCSISIRNSSHYFLHGEWRSNSANHHYRVDTYFAYRFCGKLSERRGVVVSITLFPLSLLWMVAFFSASFFSFLFFLPALSHPPLSLRVLDASLSLHILGGKQGSIEQGRKQRRGWGGSCNGSTSFIQFHASERHKSGFNSIGIFFSFSFFLSLAISLYLVLEAGKKEVCGGEDEREEIEEGMEAAAAVGQASRQVGNQASKQHKRKVKQKMETRLLLV